MSTAEIVTEANITCPTCNFTEQADMPTDIWQYFYECASCGTVFKPKDGDCCVFCSYADAHCPLMQMEAAK